MIIQAKLKAVLAALKMPQWRLARRLGFEPSTFSDYVRGSRKAPAGLQTRIEHALRLPDGSLSRRWPE